MTGARRFLAIGVMIVAVIGIVGAVLYNRSSSAEGASLRGITTDELAAQGIQLTAADSGAVISSGDATSVALKDRPEAKVIETILVNMTNGGEYKEPHLSWAVNLDPESVTMVWHCPPPGSQCPPTKAGWATYFIDAKTGEYLFFAAEGPREPAETAASAGAVTP
jgi:hypothetical protein